MNKTAGRGDLLVVTLRLESGEKLPFVVDTGASTTCFDKSLEPKLGTRLRTVTSWTFGVKQESDVFAAPRLYLGNTPLKMTGSEIIAYDCSKISSGSTRPVMGILGIDCLEHYCIQLDFEAGKMRFLDGTLHYNKSRGIPFSLSPIESGCFTIRENLSGAKGSGSLVDTGCSYDGWLASPFFQQWTNHAMPPLNGEARFPNAALAGEIYPDIDLREADLLLSDDPHMKYDGIGLHFLSRHRVTFDFPNRTLYLKRTSIYPLVDTEMEAAAKSAGKSAFKFLRSLKKAGLLPGWSRKDEVATSKVIFHFQFPASGTFDLPKKGETAIYHYEFARQSKSGTWRLQKAWRTDHDDHTVEEYRVLLAEPATP